MATRYVDLERSMSVSNALAVLRDVTDDLGLRIKSRRIAHSPGTGAGCHQVSLTTADGGSVGEACGKGIGAQALASGGYEAYEHAAGSNRLPGLRASGRVAPLPRASFEEQDRLYAFARHIRAGRPQPVLEMSAIESVAAFDRGHQVWYPRIAADYAMPAADDMADLAPLARYVTSSGYAAGNSVADALTHAVNELVERDAWSAYLLSDLTDPVPYPQVVSEAGDPLHDLVAELTAAHGAEVLIVRLPSVAGTVVAAYQRSRNPEIPSLGVGCSADPRIAVERAITELQQDAAANEAGATWVDEGGVSIDHLSRTRRLHRAAQLPAPRIGARISYDELVATSPSYPDRDLIPALHAAGFTTMWRPVWRHVVGRGALHVVQVVIPGLERFTAIVFGRPIVPAGRLWSPATSRFLLEGATNV